MSKTRWRAVLRTEGYSYSRKWRWWTKGKDMSLFLHESQIKNKARTIDFIRMLELPNCEYCNGSGEENTDGWHHGCTGCQATGKAVHLLKQKGRLER